MFNVYTEKFIEFESCGVSGVYADALFRPRSYTTLEILENSFISTVPGPTVHTIPIKNDGDLWKRS